VDQIRILDNRLLETSKKILCLLFDKSMHVNEIIRQTSPDRTYIITTIRLLERGQLITRNKRVRRGKKVMMQLTEVGRELVDILRSLKIEGCVFGITKSIIMVLSMNPYLMLYEVCIQISTAWYD
jgi:DNA-binding HxlR family transcriptional regulator